jgi:hypothetical protein
MEFTLRQKTNALARSGAYVGGIGAGGFEPHADGKFYRNQITNQWRTENQLEAVFAHAGPSGQRRMLLSLSLRCAKYLGRVAPVLTAGPVKHILMPCTS